ncbi:Toll-interacting protein B [Holothuria leucospilota]|uniref:Toll-interacting protein B n=1 Tax=Holothuria leucospilota TaxID=206669 RepID=A0A9Q1H4L8_HOLLE|nr:Toll-interacting protein B [Holothuria leucospilota]
MSETKQPNGEDFESHTTDAGAEEVQDEPLTLEEKDFDMSIIKNMKSGSESTGSSDIAGNSTRLFFTSRGDHLSVTFVRVSRLFAASEAELKETYGWFRMDPYCVMKVGSEICNTQLCPNGSTKPSWGEELRCEIPPSVSFIFIEIIDKKTFPLADQTIAWTVIPIMQLLENGGKEKIHWYDLSGQQGYNKEGRLKLITTYTPNTDRHVPEQLVLSNPANYLPNEKQQEDVNSISSFTEDEPSQQPADCTTSVPDQVGLSEEELNSMGGHLKLTCVKARLRRNYGVLTRMDSYCIVKVGTEILKTPICRSSGMYPRWNETINCNIPPGVCVVSIEIFKSNYRTDDKIAWTFILIKDLKHRFGRDVTDWYTLYGVQGENKEGVIQLTTCFKDVTVEGDRQNKETLDCITTFVNLPRLRPIDYTAQVPDKLNVILVGRGGNGKSSVGNTIMGKECFPHGTIWRQQTVQLERLQKDNFEINVMDTPNLFNERQKMSAAPRMMEILKTAMDFPDGIDLFLIVCRSDIRCGDEDKILDELEKMYGSSVFGRSLLVLTRVKEFLQNTTLEEGLKAKEDLWHLCTRVQGRVIAIQNDMEQLRNITMEEQQTLLLLAMFELVRLQKGTVYKSTLRNEVTKCMKERQERQNSIKQTYDDIFDHIVNTVSSKSETEICATLKTKEFKIAGDLFKANNVCQDQSIILQCTKWCLSDLETFTNLILTGIRFEQCSNEYTKNDAHYDSIEMYKMRSLQTAQQIKRNRQNLMNIFNTYVEIVVRSFLRSRDIFEIDNIMKNVEKNILDSDLHQQIIKSLPDYYKTEEWKTDVHFLGLQSLREYLEIKSRVWRY